MTGLPLMAGTGDISGESLKCFLRFRVVDSGVGIDEPSGKIITSEASDSEELKLDLVRGSGTLPYAVRVSFLFGWFHRSNLLWARLFVCV